MRCHGSDSCTGSMGSAVTFGPRGELRCCEHSLAPTGAHLPRHGLGAHDGKSQDQEGNRHICTAVLAHCFLGVSAGGRGSQSQLCDSAQPRTQDLLGLVLEFGGEKAF